MFRPIDNNEPLPSVNTMRRLGLEPDPWQLDLLQTEHPRVLLNCCRQSGKTTTVAVLALVQALCRALTKIIIVSRSHRQAKEVIKLISMYHLLLNQPGGIKRRSQAELEFNNFSRIISLPCNEPTIRGYAHVDLIILDEAARVPDDLYRAVRPMLAVSHGRLICLSTPYGKRGFFWKAWAQGGDDWRRFEIAASQCPRITPEFLAEERRALGEAWYRQEYCCSFEALEGLVYPDFEKCVVPAAEMPADLRFLLEDVRVPAGSKPSPAERIAMENRKDKIRYLELRLLGGIDFGFRNPFAAVWGVVDRDDVLWLFGELYQRQQPLSWHAQRLPHDVTWHADPSAPASITELRCGDFVVRTGNNAVQLGIAAVHARLAAGALKLIAGRCPNLLAEAGLYRYDNDTEDHGAEAPLSAHNHALDALRYLISRLDSHRMARQRPAPREKEEDRYPRPADRADEERMWGRAG